MKLFKRDVKLIKFLLMAWFVIVQTSCVTAQQHISLENIESKPYSGVINDKLEFMLISDSDKFHEIYRRIHSLQLPRSSPPEVDFATYHILIAFMGRKSTAGYAIGFRAAVVQGKNEIQVQVMLKSPQRGAVLAQVTTNPYALAKIAKGNYASVKFVNDESEVLDVVNVSRAI